MRPVVLQVADNLAAASGQLVVLIMVPFLVGLVGAIATLFARLITHPWRRYYDRMRRLQRHRWEALERACPTLEAIESDGGAALQQSPDGPPRSAPRAPRSGTVAMPRDGKRDWGFGLWNPPSRETAREVIASVLEAGTDQLPAYVDLADDDTVADGLAMLEEPKLVYRRCRWSFRHCFWLFVVGWVPGAVAGSALVLPRSLPLLVGVGVLLACSAAAFLGAIYKGYRYWWLRKRMDRMVERAEMF